MLYVDGVKLGKMLEDWEANWERAHEPHPGDPEFHQDPTLAARDALALRTERTGTTVSRMTIYRLINGRRTRAPFYRTADPLCTAMGCTEVYENGVLPVLGEERRAA